MTVGTVAVTSNTLSSIFEPKGEYGSLILSLDIFCRRVRMDWGAAFILQTQIIEKVVNYTSGICLL